MKKWIFNLILFFGFSTQAGDGGFMVKTCVSNSGRTVYTYFVDFYSDTTVPYRTVLVVDGHASTYVASADSSYVVDPKYGDGEDTGVTVKDQVSRETVLDVTFNGNNAVIAGGWKDPRQNSDLDGYGKYPLDNSFDIALTCKKPYYQAP